MKIKFELGNAWLCGCSRMTGISVAFPDLDSPPFGRCIYITRAGYPAARSCLKAQPATLRQGEPNPSIFEILGRGDGVGSLNGRTVGAVPEEVDRRTLPRCRV